MLRAQHTLAEYYCYFADSHILKHICQSKNDKNDNGSIDMEGLSDALKNIQHIMHIKNEIELCHHQNN